MEQPANLVVLDVVFWRLWGRQFWRQPPFHGGFVTGPPAPAESRLAAIIGGPTRLEKE
jgi:hypothetical protein